MTFQHLPTPLQEYVHKSRYARWLPELQRRENWDETVQRYVDYFDKKFPHYPAQDVYKAILEQRSMPSMRALMTAGPALERDPMAGYNCAFVAIDHPRAFDEILYILMCGTGMGFSVERQFIAQLPIVGTTLALDSDKKLAVRSLDQMQAIDHVIVVEDSKEGWSSAFRDLINFLYEGKIPLWDTSRVRAAGEKLKIFGGRASGSKPLIDLFKFTVDTFKDAIGRKLTSIECHDLVCKIADIVVVGGVRRCLPATAQVFTPTGPKMIKDITVGDTIVTGGKEAQVLAAGSSGVKDTIIINHRFGKLECTPEHRVAVFTSMMKYEFKEAQHIVKGDRLVWDTVGYEGSAVTLPSFENNSHFNAKVGVTVPTELSTELAWFFGLFHGDGCVEEKGISIAGNMAEITTLERAAAIIKTEFGIESTCGHDGRKGGLGARVRVSSCALRQWFNTHIKQSHTPIRVPAFIMNAPREIRFAYLAGLLDADGRVKKDGGIDQTCTIYKEYADDLVTLLAGLGISATAMFSSAANRREKGEQAKDFWNVAIVGATNRKLFYTGALENSFKLKNRTPNFSGFVDFSFPIRWSGGSQGYATNGNISVSAMRYDLPLLPTRVTSIEKGRTIETYDIQVEGLEQFTTDGIVVHNSALISLSNVSDDRMRCAKSGLWWVNDPQRALANNSAAYTERPEMEVFMKEWLALVESKSGERGIFNRQASINKAIESGRRDHTKIVGVNPCFAPGTLIHTDNGSFPIETLLGKTVNIWDGTDYSTIDNFRVTGENVDVLKLTLQDGSEIKATPYHTFYLADGSKIEMKDLEPGMKLLISNAPEAGTGLHTKSAYLKGFMIGDGSTCVSGPLLWLYEPKFMCEKRLFDSAAETSEEFIKGTIPVSQLGFIQSGDGRKRMQGLTQRRTELGNWGNTYKNGLPSEVYAWGNQSKANFLAGLFDADGCALDTANGFGYQITGTSKQLMLDVQTLLKTIGVFGKVATNKEVSTVDFHDGYGVYATQKLYRLTLSQEAAINFAKQVKFERLQSFADRTMKYQLKPRWNAVVSIEHAGIEEKVYCCTVPVSHQVSLAVGVTTGQCAEISLRSKGVCNLTEVVLRAGDSYYDVLENIRIAVIMGTFQSLLTDFRYVRQEWRDNQIEERLLGVSLTGIMDHEVLNKTNSKSIEWLKGMKGHAIEVNKLWAKKLGINQSVAITTVKPSGTVSQLVDAASGIHPRYSDYYIRTVRGDKKDPLALLMRAQGFPVEDCAIKPDSVDIFSFPVKAPQKAVFRNDRSAIEQLKHYLMFQTHWSEHNVSITVYVKDYEWLGVGDWVYHNFGSISGVSFLPHSNHSYRQAPYQECSKEEYQALLRKMPEFDCKALSEFEKDDTTVNTKELACSAGHCEIL